MKTVYVLAVSATNWTWLCFCAETFALLQWWKDERLTTDSLFYDLSVNQIFQNCFVSNWVTRLFTERFEENFLCGRVADTILCWKNLSNLLHFYFRCLSVAILMGWWTTTVSVPAVNSKLWEMASISQTASIAHTFCFMSGMKPKLISFCSAVFCKIYADDV